LIETANLARRVLDNSFTQRDLAVSGEHYLAVSADT
jgi:hypothetical protein